MIIRTGSRRMLLLAVALLGASCGVSAAPVVVSDYPGLVGTIGANNSFGTGDRFYREGLVLVHNGASCEPNFNEMGLSGFGRHPDMFSLLSVDVDHAEKDLLDKLGVDPAALSNPGQCPTLVVIPRRSSVHGPSPKRPARDSRSNNFHLPAVKLQQVSVGIVNEMDVDLDIHYQWWDDPIRPTHIRKIWSRETGSAYPSRVSLLISILKLNLVLTYGIPPESRGLFEATIHHRENWMLSYKTTIIVARNKETQEEVARHLVTGHGLFTVAERDCGVDTCGTSEASELPQDRASREARRQQDQSRLNNNKRQPQGLPRFTEVGFKKTRVPDDVWDVVKTYYEENKDSPKKEKWGKHNVFTNNVEAPSYMVNLPENGEVKQKIFDGLRPILEEWAGVELVQTACYGIRVYTNTSWLANHVDTRATHAVSVIMNVDQSVEEDWPLMIYDHAGNDYNITMKPRDLVLYESATCVHGRPSTFHGKFYANAFVHYKPTDPEKWAKFAE